jgi:probable phosphoglycerate mutase
MLLYIVRHGDPIYETDSLTERGKLQAEAVGKRMYDARIDRIFSSPMGRARETAEIALPGVPYEVTPLIREISVGDLEGIRFVDGARLVPALKDRVPGDLDFTAVNGESYEDLMERVRAFLDLAQSTGEERIAAFCHGGFIHGVLDAVLGARHSITRSEASNCAVTVVEWTGKNWKLITWNYTGKL